MIVGMKFSLMSMVLMERQSVVGSPIRRQMLSMAILTAFGGLARERTSTNCCFLMDLTATGRKGKKVVNLKSYFLRIYVCVSP